MKRFVEGEDRRQAPLLPECLDDDAAPDNPVRLVAAFVAELDLAARGFAGVVPEATGRPSYHPALAQDLPLRRSPRPRPAATPSAVSSPARTSSMTPGMTATPARRVSIWRRARCAPIVGTASIIAAT